MICPKCHVANDNKYTFCLECGTALNQKSDVSSEPPPTALFPLDDFSKTAIMPPEKLPTPPEPRKDLPETVFIKPEKIQPTQIMPPIEIPPTVQYSNPQTTKEQQISPTQPIEVPPTALFTQENTSPNNQQSNPQLAATQYYVPSESVETVISPKIESEHSVTKPVDNPPTKKSRKIFLIAGILLLLLLGGGGAAVYFLAQPMQSDRIYTLSDKQDVKDNILSLDGATKTFSMVGTDQNGFQRWQITPDPSDKNFYRFVNRGLGEGESFEVVDDKVDNKVSMARSAKDTGQLWAITNVQGDYYRITNQWLGDTKALSNYKRSYYFLRIRDTNTVEDGQLWKKVETGDGQSFYLVNKLYGDKLALEAYGSGEFVDKLAMTAKTNAFSPDNRWIFKDDGSGNFTLTTDRYEKSGVNKFLELNPTKDGRIMMSANSPAQSWKLVPVGSDGYFRLVNNKLGDGKSLEAVTFAQYSLEMVTTSDIDNGQLWQLTRKNK